MDVRQLAFLGRQPSAALEKREHFLGLPKRGLAFILANAMFWQPLLVQADGIVVSAPGTTLGQAGNGVPIVNIAAPNAQGLSHNQFHDYNVGVNGVILNNATGRTQSTQLGGIILGNQNLNGRSANIILNEVTGASPSQLRGYTEVAGQSAHVIVANPYGISCNGCGFINTPQATLTTGKAVISNGQLTGYQVDQGSVSIEGAGLNAGNIDRFEIITRSAKLNAEINAKKLAIIAGANDVDAKTLKATARAANLADAPQLAIDSSALGGMYAGAIKLVGTEAGVGVKLDGKMVASGGDIQLDANGHLSLAETAATGAVNVKAASLEAKGPMYAGTTLDVNTRGDLTSQSTLAAKDRITLSSGGQLTNNGIIEAGVNADNTRNTEGDVSVTAQNFSNTGKSVIANRDLKITTTQTLNNQGGTLSGQRQTTLDAGTLDNRNKGRVLSSATLDLKAAQVLNAQDGLISSNGNLVANVGALNNNDGELSSLADVTLNVATLDNVAGLVAAQKGLSLTASGALNNHGGTLSSSTLATLKAASLDNAQGQVTGDLGLDIDLSGALSNQGGTLGSGQALNLSATSLDNRAAGTVLAAGGNLRATISGAFDNREQGKLRATAGIDLTTGSLDNRGGSLAGKDQLTLRSASADNRGGLIQADRDLQLRVDQLDNRDKGNLTSKAAIGYEGTRLDNSGGLLSAVGPVSLKAKEVANAAGRIASQGDLTANIDSLNQQGGALVAQGSLLLAGKTLDNRNGGTVASTQGLTVNVEQIDNRSGELSSTRSGVNLTGQRLDNSDGGKLLSETDLELAVAQLINQNKGRLFAKGNANLSGTSLDNAGGNVSALKGLDIRLDGALLNNAGGLSSEGALSLAAGNLDNTAGKLGSAGNLSISSLGALLNQGGSILTDQGLVLDSASLDNSQKGQINGKGATRVTTALLDNSQGGRLTSDDSLDLTATQVSNGASGRIASAKDLTASVTGLDQQGGELFSKTHLSLDLNNGQLDNSNGLINGPLLVLKNLNDVVNRNGEISSGQAFALAAHSLDNSSGKLLSNQGLTLRINQALNNVKGLIAAASLDSRSAGLDNSHGLISSQGAIDLGVSDRFINQDGTLVGDGALLLAANLLDNSNGAISGKADVTANITTLNNQGGKLIASAALALTGTTLDNRQNGLVGATKALKLNVDTIDNRAGELSGAADISVTASRLDNSDGGNVLAETTLALNTTQVLNRNQGLLKGKTGVTLDGQGLDNSGGQLGSGQDIRVTLAGDLDNSRGLVSGEGQLEINATNLTNTAGNLSSAGALKVKATGTLGNQGGRLVSDGSLNLASASLDNTGQGVISGKGTVGITTGAYDNSQGSLGSGDSLTLTAGQVTNRSGSIGSDKALTASVTGLDQQDGKLFSSTALTLDLNNGQLNNRNGLINAPSLVLNNLAWVNNQGGEISSAQAFTVVADSLDNSNGKLLSNQALTLRVNQALANLKGQIAAAALDVRAASLDNGGGTLTSRSDLNLTTSGHLSNQNQGLINAAQSLTVSSGDLNNLGGTLLGVSAVTLNAMALSNSGNGLINSQAGLTINASSLDSANGGEVSAKGDIDLSLGALSQNGGRLLGDQAIRLDLAGGDLDNRNGLLNAKGPLTLNRLRDLNNRNGELSSNQSFNLAGRTLDNSGGKLISNNQLGVAGGDLINQGGLISGWQGLAVNGASLDNRNSGTLSSRSGNLDVSVSGALLNSNAGALVSQQALTVNAASLDNSAGILSSGAGQRLTVSGLLNNTQGGSIDSAAALTLQAMALNNSGTISAQQALEFTGTTLDNSNGTLTGKGAVSLDLFGVLTNSNGKLASAGPLLISRSSQINNQGGQLVSQGLMSLLTGGLDNSNRGTVAANDNLLISSAGALQNNSDGLIYSQNGDVRVSAASLANGKGSLQGQGALNLTVAGDIDNQSGKLIAQNGDLSVSAANLDNRGGTLASVKGALEARIVGVLKNGYDLNNNRQGGIIQAQRLNLSALGGIDNYGGRISAQSGDALVTTADFDNRNGGLYAKGLVQVSGNNFDNSGGQIAGQRIDLSLNGGLNNRLGITESDSTLSVRAASLDNQTGQLRALGTSGKTDFQIGGLFDNRNGKLETANSDLTLNAGSFQNQGGSLLHVGNGTFDIATANLLNAGGSLVTRGGLTLTADNWTNSSVIQAGRLTLNVNTLNQTAGGQLLASDSLVGNGGNWNNDGLIASDGSLQLTLGGTYGGSGRASSQGTFGLNAAQLNLASAGSLAGGGVTSINVGGQLINRGRLTSASDLIIKADTVQNIGTLGASRDLVVTAQNLINDHEAADINIRGFVFSGENSTFNVNSLTNNYGEFFSLGSLAVAGVAAGSAAQNLRNISGRIQSTGDMTLAVNELVNEREKFKLNQKLTSVGVSITCTQHCSGGWSDRRPMLTLSRTVEGVIEENSPSATLSAGRNLSITGKSFLNRYSVVSAANDLSIQGDSIVNQAATGGSGSDSRQVSANPKIPKAQYNQLVQAVNNYNRAHPQGGPVDEAAYAALLAQFNPAIFAGINDPLVIRSNGAIAAPAIIQAGGNARLNARNDISNISVVKTALAVDGRPVDTAVGGNKTAVVVVNSQLPADRAQQQVNPLTLPGFNLPSGQNGLFRLSGQAGSATPASQAHAGPLTWNMGSAAVSNAQRQQGADDVQARDLQFTDTTRIAASNLQLEQSARQVTGSSVSGSVINVATPGDTGSVELAGQNGTVASVGSQVINRVQGLPDTSGRSNPQKYLIETNPVLTDLKQFMSSDYLLAGLGYNPDQSAKRLGDGFYEQKLIQQAVTQRTGQRFIDGQTSDDGLFKYLMDNAIKSKQQLGLSVGVTLTSQQVAALTHDIVWLEEHEVNGEKVLVPVLYLAQATNRLAPNGALIQGADVTLIAGKDLENSGTLRASNNLSAVAGNDLVNSGLVEAGNRLDLLAANNLTNKAGGIISGRDVSMVAVNGDVINERTVTTQDTGNDLYSRQRSFVDNAARIEAANNLTISAGQDVINTGSVLHSGADTVIRAGRDINIDSTARIDKDDRGPRGNSSSISQSGSVVSTGRDLQLTAGRDLAVIGSQIDVQRDVSMAAVENLTLGSAADESHSYSKSKKLKTQEDHVKQIATSVTAGGDVALSAGKDMTLVSSRINAGDEAYLVAGGELNLLAAQDSDYSLFDEKKKGSFGKLKARHDEVTQVTNVGSEIKTGGNLTLKSGDDQRYQVAKLESGKDITLDSGGSITFEGVKDLHDENHTKTNNNAFWNASKGKGNTDETLRQSQMAAAGSITIKAVEGLKIDVKQVNQQTVTQTIDAMVKADPKLAWLKDAEKRGDVDWRQVKEIHESFKYNTSGLGPASQLIIAIALAAVMGPMMAGWNTMAQAGTLSVATKATVSTINNRGNLGAIVKDVTSKDSLKGYAVSIATAGVAQGLGYSPSGMGLNAESAKTIALKVTADAVIKTAVYGGSFQDNLTSSAMGTAASIGGAVGAGKIGDLVPTDGSFEKILLHAGLGGLLSKAMGGDFRTGAIAGGANEVLVGLLGDKLLPENLVPGTAEYTQAEANLLAISQIAGVLGAVMSGTDVGTAAAVAANATQYNYLSHQKFDEVNNCLSGKTCSTQEQKDSARAEAEKLSQTLDKEMRGLCDKDPSSDACRTAVNSAIKYVAIQDAWESMGNDVARSSGNTFDYLYNTKGAAGRLVTYLNTIDNRADFFGATNVYEQHLGIGAKWFGGAEEVSRARLTGLGADGNMSYVTFAGGWALAPVYDWRKSAGDALITGGFDNFKDLYNKVASDPVAWDIKQLKGEQSTLQPIHERYLKDHQNFVDLSKLMTDTSGLAGRFLNDRQGMEGGIDILDYKSRVAFGCKLLGYSAAQGCTP